MSQDHPLLQRACDILKAGHVVGMPTETVYGLAGDGTNDQAVTQIYTLKGRPSFNPLIFHVNSLEMAQQFAHFSKEALRVAHYFWETNPGPLTLVLPRNEKSAASLLACAGLDTIAIRRPHHPLAMELMTRFGKPLVAPSANISNQLSPTQAADVEKDFPGLYVLDGGACTVGLESTIVGMTHDTPIILRHGGVLAQQIEALLGQPVEHYTHDNIIAPGMMKKHYAPRKPLRIDVDEPDVDEDLLGFGQNYPHAFSNLSPKGCVTEAASNFFAFMRQMDGSPKPKIAVAPIPHEGLGIAINDRLLRAVS